MFFYGGYNGLSRYEKIFYLWNKKLTVQSGDGQQDCKNLYCLHKTNNLNSAYNRQRTAVQPATNTQRECGNI